MQISNITKIVFLDVDGVINPTRYENALDKMWSASEGKIKSRDKYGRLFFPQNCEALRKIVDTTGAKIVISSSWRQNGESEMKALWEYRNLAGEIIGITPNEIDVVESGKVEFYDLVCRGDEIELWLQRNNYTGKYVIIDNNNDMSPEQQQFFVQTDERFGLTECDADKAIEILNKN